jgi:two-component system nitrogen regulation response regulator GlnG/two-component system response regulator HydG
MRSDSTLPEAELPWKRTGEGDAREALFLTIAWSLEEPGRIGEAAMIDEPSLLGRGPAQPGDKWPRVEFRRLRPGESDPRGPLRDGRISRVQLQIAPEQGALDVESVGRSAMRVRGAETSHARVEPGGVIVLKNSLALLVTRRPRVLPPLKFESFPFARADSHGIVGESPAAWSMREGLTIAAAGGHHVLLQGESGSGKELAARAIHALSPRAGKPLVSRNAATVPEGLVDAELFGTAKSYPNSGSPERPGLAGEADGSTHFLDEIGELPAPLQAHLLRLLDRGGEYQRLGESRMRKSDLRVVAATNRPLDALKHDFAARFAARVHVPGLQERREDIPLLARHLLTRLQEPLRGRFLDAAGEPRVDPDLIEALLLRDYTHHLRELERLLWLAASTSRGDFVELTAQVRDELDAGPAAGAAEIDAARIQAALQEAGGNVTAAARALGLKNRYVLYRLMKRHGLAPPPAGESSD